MKTTFALAVALFLSLHGFAQDSTKTSGTIPDYYLTVKKGKLIEHNGDRHRVVTKDLTLTDATTIHPDGSMDLGSGESRKLKKGEYLTMDGQIRKLKNMGKPKGPKWTTGS